MRIKFSDLWRWDGAIGRGEYALIGVLAFAIKHNLDRYVAGSVFHKPWGVPSYWFPPTTAVLITGIDRGDAIFLASMVALSLPFAWIGTVLTLRRLRDTGLPPGFVILFFAPFLNVLFFVLLSVLPSRAVSRPGSPPWKNLLDRMIPDDWMGSAGVAVLTTLILGVAAIELCLKFFVQYGWGMFIALPFCLGLISALIYGYHEPRSLLGCQVVSAISLGFVGLALLVMAYEGAVCLLMAMPLALVLAAIGATIGYAIQRRPGRQALAASLTLFVVVSLPGLMGAESYLHLEPPCYEVRTSMEIDAPPGEVWKSLVAFPRLSPPKEWLFRLGIAFPMEAWLRGQGVGSMRECLFSTGTFVEVIQVWDEGRLLQFSIAAQAPPMLEMSPYPEVHPPHLDGYLHPEHAEFRLTALPHGRTRLSGTSWYKNEMWPAGYWRLWSDEIIHRVHLRVFEHVKRLSEKKACVVDCRS